MMKEHDFEREAIERIDDVLRRVPMISDIVTQQVAGPDDGADFKIDARIGGMPIRLLVEVKSDGQPRSVKNAVWGLHYYTQRHFDDAYPIIVAPYLSERSRGICDEARVGYLDFEGNCKIAFAGVFIEKSVPTKPKIARKASGGLFTPKASRVLRTLLRDPDRSWKVQDLADDTGVSIGQISNVRRALIDGNWIPPEAQGVHLNDPSQLLHAWRNSYQRPKGDRLGFYTPLHGEALAKALRETSLSNSGSIVAAAATAAQWLAPYLRSPTETFYVDDVGLRTLRERLALTPRDRGGNVDVTVVSDQGVFLDRIEPAPQIWTTGIVQTFLDLATLGERGQEAAEHLRRKLLPWSTQK